MAAQLLVFNQKTQAFTDAKRLEYPAYADLRDALSEFFQKTGASKLCTLCFKGLYICYESSFAGEWYSQKGCCGNCKHLSPTTCVAKPLACAAFACGELHNEMPEAFGEILGAVQRRLARRQIYTRCYASSWDRDTQHQGQFRKKKQVLLRTARLLRNPRLIARCRIAH